MKESTRMLGETIHDVTPSYLNPKNVVEEMLSVAEEFEARRQQLPFYKRWFYCISSMIEDLRSLKEVF